MGNSELGEGAGQLLVRPTIRIEGGGLEVDGAGPDALDRRRESVGVANGAGPAQAVLPSITKRPARKSRYSSRLVATTCLRSYWRGLLNALPRTLRRRSLNRSGVSTGENLQPRLDSPGRKASIPRLPLSPKC